MSNDPILEEIWRRRREVVQVCEGDWEKLLAHYKEVEKRVPADLVVQRQPKRKAVEEGRR